MIAAHSLDVIPNFFIQENRYCTWKNFVEENFTRESFAEENFVISFKNKHFVICALTFCVRSNFAFRFSHMQ